MRFPLTALLSALLLAGCQHKVIAHGGINGTAARKALAKTVELRGLPPLRPVHFSLLLPDALRAEIRADLAAEEHSGFYTRTQKALPLLGLLHPDVDVRSTFERIYTGETLGYYDTRREVMRLVPRSIMRTEIIEIIAAVRGRDHLYGEALAHELTHALTDQHFDLDAFLDLPSDATGGDGELARRCLAEGDASLVGHRYGGVLFRKVDRMVRYIKKRVPAMYKGKGIPRYYRERFIFPYLDGLLFVSTLYESGGWASVDAAYADPPVSSEQILHPEKYLSSPRDLPRPVKVEGLDEVLGSGWKLIFDDVLGELGAREALALWIPAAEAVDAAAGWDGDRAVVLEGKGGRLCAVWRSVWDDEKEAEVFATQLNRALTKRRKATGTLAGGVYRKKDEVLMVLGDLPVAGARIAERVWSPPPSPPESTPSTLPGSD